MKQHSYVKGGKEKTSISTVDGPAHYIKTEVEDSDGRWNDDYYVADGFYVLHDGIEHHVYQVIDTSSELASTLAYLMDPEQTEDEEARAKLASIKTVKDLIIWMRDEAWDVPAAVAFLNKRKIMISGSAALELHTAGWST